MDHIPEGRGPPPVLDPFAEGLAPVFLRDFARKSIHRKALLAEPSGEFDTRTDVLLIDVLRDLLPGGLRACGNVLAPPPGMRAPAGQEERFGVLLLDLLASLVHLAASLALIYALVGMFVRRCYDPPRAGAPAAGDATAGGTDGGGSPRG